MSVCFPSFLTGSRPKSHLKLFTTFSSSFLYTLSSSTFFCCSCHCYSRAATGACDYCLYQKRILTQLQIRVQSIVCTKESSQVPEVARGGMVGLFFFHLLLPSNHQISVLISSSLSTSYSLSLVIIIQLIIKYFRYDPINHFIDMMPIRIVVKQK